MAKLLVVDDEPAIREMVKFSLTRCGFECIEAEDAAAAKRSISSDRPDLLLLDVMMPGQSGLDLARELRSKDDTKDIPIIMLTARGTDQDKIRGLDVGADDYMTKPFSPGELVARINALLRRSSLDQSELQLGGLRLNPETHEVFSGDTRIELSPMEFKLLHFLMARPERVFSRAQLLDRVWGNENYIEDRTVDVHIRRLRAALESGGHAGLIQTVRGVGYRLSAKGDLV
jgi:two-component system, OmpR family, phosphate regulon response regulator PhoB